MLFTKATKRTVTAFLGILIMVTVLIGNIITADASDTATGFKLCLSCNSSYLEKGNEYELTVTIDSLPESAGIPLSAVFFSLSYDNAVVSFAERTEDNSVKTVAEKTSLVYDDCIISTKTEGIIDACFMDYSFGKGAEGTITSKQKVTMRFTVAENTKAEKLVFSFVNNSFGHIGCAYAVGERMDVLYNGEGSDITLPIREKGYAPAAKGEFSLKAECNRQYLKAGNRYELTVTITEMPELENEAITAINFDISYNKDIVSFPDREADGRTLIPIEDKTTVVYDRSSAIIGTREEGILNVCLMDWDFGKGKNGRISLGQKVTLAFNVAENCEFSSLSFCFVPNEPDYVHVGYGVGSATMGKFIGGKGKDLHLLVSVPENFPSNEYPQLKNSEIRIVDRTNGVYKTNRTQIPYALKYNVIHDVLYVGVYTSFQPNAYTAENRQLGKDYFESSANLRLWLKDSSSVSFTEMIDITYDGDGEPLINCMNNKIDIKKAKTVSYIKGDRLFMQCMIPLTFAVSDNEYGMYAAMSNGVADDFLCYPKCDSMPCNAWDTVNEIKLLISEDDHEFIDGVCIGCGIRCILPGEPIHDSINKKTVVCDIVENEVILPPEVLQSIPLTNSVEFRLNGICLTFSAEIMKCIGNNGKDIRISARSSILTALTEEQTKLFASKAKDAPVIMLEICVKAGKTFVDFTDGSLFVTVPYTFSGLLSCKTIVYTANGTKEGITESKVASSKALGFYTNKINTFLLSVSSLNRLNDVLTEYIYYEKDNTKYIMGIEPRTSVSAFFKNENIKVFNSNGNEVKGGNACTGYMIKLYDNGEVVDMAVIAIKGDINGDGYISASDYIHLRLQILGILKLGNEYRICADMNNDNSITSSDYIKLRLALLGVTVISQK